MQHELYKRGRKHRLFFVPNKPHPLLIHLKDWGVGEEAEAEERRSVGSVLSKPDDDRIIYESYRDLDYHDKK